VGRFYLGIQEIPIDRIVGSVDRSADLGRDFRPRRGLSHSRLASLRSASLPVSLARFLFLDPRATEFYVDWGEGRQRRRGHPARRGRP
jgi:hypothetical protein